MAGRPPKYKPEFAKQAYKFCLMGATDKQLADFFEVVESTINKWKLDFPEFAERVRAGKDEADARVGEALYQRATGYSHPEDKIFNDNGTPMVVPTTKNYPPDTTACIFWLKNRQKATWRDKQEHEHSGEMKHSHNTMTTDDLIGRLRQIASESSSAPVRNGSVDVSTNGHSGRKDT